ncbi:MAG: molybdopterin molybdotransferase MoeA [Gammaproteobacteria bacterium]|nr:molybdopterin molybdotransferase MoeA [Gammaproteobacteria bacterium]
MAIDKQASCADEVEPALLPVEEAVQRIAALLQPVDESEVLPIRECLNRVLAADIASPIDVPSHTNSAMDGYAINADDIPSKDLAVLDVIGIAWAGKPFEGVVSRGQAVRIMTGAAMPDGADTVVIQEHVQVENDRLTLDADNSPGQNVRHAGEDVKKGEIILHKGTLLTPAHLGMMASLGIASAAVVRRLRVAFFSTGDELRALSLESDQQLGKGEIYDSNRYSLFGMLKRLDVEPLDLGVVPDKPELIRETFERAAEVADVIVTSGGVSVGDADFVSEILHEIGDIAFWKLAMRPGRPLACGKLGNAVFFGLPGNPVAVMVTFYEFVQPALQMLMGRSATQAQRFRVRCTSKLRKSAGRAEFQRGILYTDESGETRVKSTGKQGAGRLSSMCSANCIIVIEPGGGDITPGDWVEVQPFFGLI